LPFRINKEKKGKWISVSVWPATLSYRLSYKIIKGKIFYKEGFIPEFRETCVDFRDGQNAGEKCCELHGYKYIAASYKLIRVGE
jgi:hypothetical protein